MDNNTKLHVKYAKYDKIKYKHRLHGRKLERTVNTFKNITALKELHFNRKILYVMILINNITYSSGDHSRIMTTHQRLLNLNDNPEIC